ncbi:beta-mannosidase [Pedobacter frigiditerrae]|uniref:Beta-mannosidase n=1 Tax=Pedobacter frigiditerrae TaxID=2530452 RepID=A0A4V2MIZ5_9SPHI|nr:discoidin domain-containing protein [Pedobacter frigiditerrae]TCC92366.1 beta-mannosidase [Pedobacter frigiditerrae]
MLFYFTKTINVLILLMLLTISLGTYAQEIVSLNSSSMQLWSIKPKKEVGDIITFWKPDFKQQDWVKAVVPGTIYTSYVEAGLEKDPNFADHIWKADRAKFDQSFWYVTNFEVPISFDKEKIWLNFNGVNRKADVYLNGTKLGALNGFMERGKYDIGGIVNKNKKNILAVLVDMPQRPMANSASPTYVSSGGWDWMPYVPGLNSGITDKVFLSNSGSLTIQDPWVRTKLPTNARADLSIALAIKNTENEEQTAYINGVIMPGNIEFVKKIKVDANDEISFLLDKREFEQLAINNPKLWWPNGYGEPNLYTCKLSVVVNNQVSDTQTIKFGVKSYTYDTVGQVFHLYINGKRIFVKGGNWAMSEYMLRCRGEEYDTKVRLHKEMNFNMIRNWIGSTTDEEFYEACDKYGIMIWDDFWLNSNPVLPRDVNNFNANVIEKIKRFRNHPSIAVWCGDNEGWPEAPLNNWLKENIATFDGNDRYYQANSHADNLSGSGPWMNKDPRYYFTQYPTGLGGNDGWGFRTELGSAVFTNVESFKKMIPKENWWPRNDMWDKHFFGTWAFNAGADQYEQSINTRYGKATGIEDFCKKAQLLNIETNKAMYEGWLDHIWEDASGIMTWTSNASNPTFVWQTYDYYYDLNGAYWGVKEACEPIHIQWNPVNNEIKVVNTSANDMNGLTAEVNIFNMDGKQAAKYNQVAKVNSLSNAAVTAFKLPFQGDKVNLALNKPCVASSSSYSDVAMVNDGKNDTRWASNSTNDEWIYVDLGKKEVVTGVKLNWEQAYAKVFKIQLSNDAKSWNDAMAQVNGKEGIQEFIFSEEKEARYVRILGIERGSYWGYSLWNFEVFAGDVPSPDLSSVHFLKLKLTDAKGQLISDNLYWRGINKKNFTALGQLPKAKLEVVSTEKTVGDKHFIEAKITNPKSAKTIAFAVRVQPVKASNGEQILPHMINDSYFTLMPGESKDIKIEFKSDLIKNDSVKLSVVPYNN